MKLISTSASSKELYNLLGLPENATIDEIRDAFRNISRTHHPDLTDGVTSEFYVRVKHAYDTLIDPVARQIYDTSGDSVDRVTSMAFKAINEAITSVIDRGEYDLNLKKEVIGILNQHKELVSKALSGGNQIIKAAQEIKTRLEKRWHGSDKAKTVMITAATTRIAQIEPTLIEIQNQLDGIKTAITMLKQADYDWSESVPAINLASTADMEKLMLLSLQSMWKNKFNTWDDVNG